MKNLAGWDRGLRVLGGAAALLVGFVAAGEGLTGTLLRFAGWYPLVTGLCGWCPFYALLGVRSGPPPGKG